MTRVNDFIDSYHNGRVCREYVERTKSTREGWHVQPVECKYCGPHEWHGVPCESCDCWTASVNLRRTACEDHIVRGEN